MADLRELKARLEAVKKAVRAESKAALKATAEEIAATMRRVVPKDTGKLRSTIRVVENDDLSVRIQAGGPETTKRVRSDRKAKAPEVDYAKIIEFGTRKRPAHPFFWPTWRLMRRSARLKVERRIKKALEATGGGG